MSATVEIVEWQPMSKNTLRGFVTVKLQSGMIVHGVTVHQKDDGTWCNPPSRPMQDRLGQPIMQNGKSGWLPVVSFVDRKTRDRFSSAVLEALALAYPGAVQ